MKRKERRKKNIRKICRFFTSLDDGDDAKEQWSLRTQVTIEPLRNNQPALNISLLELLWQLQFVFSGIISTFYVFLYHFYPFSRFWSSQRRARLLLSSTKLCQGLTNKERFKQTQQEGRFFTKIKSWIFKIPTFKFLGIWWLEWLFRRVQQGKHLHLFSFQTFSSNAQRTPSCVILMENIKNLFRWKTNQAHLPQTPCNLAFT